MQDESRMNNLNLFNGLYELVSDTYYSDEPQVLRITGEILSKYDWVKIQYAIENFWHLFDLDRWQLSHDYFKEYKGNPEKNLENVLAEYGVRFEGALSLADALNAGEFFLTMVVDPLYERGIEIVEILEFDKDYEG